MIIIANIIDTTENEKNYTRKWELFFLFKCYYKNQYILLEGGLVRMNNIELYKKYIVYSHGKRNNSFSQLVVSKRAILTNNRLCCSFLCKEGFG